VSHASGLCKYVEIYVLSDGEHLKIGITSIGKLEARISNLQTSNARKLELVGHRSGERTLERDIHCDLQDQCVRGEWFRDVPETWVILGKHEILRLETTDFCPNCGALYWDDDCDAGEEWCIFCPYEICAPCPNCDEGGLSFRDYTGRCYECGHRFTDTELDEAFGDTVDEAS
jgi:hypothetical protein